jgi:alpha-glucosidase
MWLKKELSGNWHVGFLKSTSALETDILVGRSMGIHITGGNIILKFFLGDKNPETPIKAYHRYINGYAIHPFWSQGYH